MSEEIPPLSDGDLVEIVWDGGNGPYTYVVRVEHGVPVAYTTGPLPMRVSPISKIWVRSAIKR